jgi:hypothetical protein
MGLTSLTLIDDRLQASQPSVLNLFYTVTSGAVTRALTRNPSPTIFGTAAGDFTQAAINALLSPDNGPAIAAASTAEVNAAVVFGSTAMGADAFGFVVSCQGQIGQIAGFRTSFFPGTEDTKFTIPVAALPDTLTAGLLLTPLGNLVGRVIPTGLDLGTGVLQLEIYFWSK